MQLDAAQRAYDRAARDYRRATHAMFHAETPAAQKRHARKARVAQQRMRDAARDRARLACDAEAFAEFQQRWAA